MNCFIMHFFQNAAQWVRSYIFHKSFLIGIVVSVGVLSPYAFGPDNLAEEVVELFVYKETGVFIDFTPKSKEEIAKDYQEILELSRKSIW